MKETVLISLSGDLTFATATIQHVNLSAQIRKTAANRIIIDLIGVQRSDSAGIALLIEILKDASNLNKEIIFKNLPDQIKALVSFSNLSNILTSVECEDVE